jgi:hypothetical protein
MAGQEALPGVCLDIISLLNNNDIASDGWSGSASRRMSWYGIFVVV